MNNATQKKKTPLSLIVGYGFGELGGQMSWYMINTYLMIFYTDVVGLTASAISLIMLIARVWDAINDPMMGMLCDRTHTRWGKFRPYIMFAPPVLAIFNILTFTVMPVKGVAKVLLCLLFYIGAGMAYTVVMTAYASLVNVVSKDSQERQTLSASRNMFSSIGSTIMGAVAMPLILFFGKSEVATAKGYFWTTVVFSVAMIPIYFITAGTCKENYIEELHGEKTEEKRSIIESLKTVFKNDQLMIVVLNTLGGTIGVLGRMTMLSYYVIYVVGSYTMIAPIYTIMSIGALLGSCIIPTMTARLGKKTYALLLNGIMAAGFIIMYAFPVNNMAFLLVISFVIGIGNSSQGVAYGMVSDSIEYGDYKNGVREEGLSCSFLSLSAKIATAVCGSVGVLLLASIGYVPNAAQTETAKNGINFVVNIIPAICVVVSMIPLFFYKLENKKMVEIGKELERRRAEEK